MPYHIDLPDTTEYVGDEPEDKPRSPNRPRGNDGKFKEEEGGPGSGPQGGRIPENIFNPEPDRPGLTYKQGQFLRQYPPGESADDKPVVYEVPDSDTEELPLVEEDLDIDGMYYVADNGEVICLDCGEKLPDMEAYEQHTGAHTRVHQAVKDDPDVDEPWALANWVVGGQGGRAKKLESRGAEDVSVSGPPAGDQMPANFIEDKKEGEEQEDRDVQEIALLTQLLNNELEEEEKGEDETEDIALIAQLLDLEEGEVAEEYKKKASEQSPNSLLRYSEPIDLPTGKNAMDQTYGMTEPEADGQDLTGKTVGEQIEKEPYKPTYHYFKQYPFGRIQKGPFGEEADFKEEEHPRDEGGQFASKGAGAPSDKVPSDDYSKTADDKLGKTIRHLQFFGPKQDDPKEREAMLDRLEKAKTEWDKRDETGKLTDNLKSRFPEIQRVSSEPVMEEPREPDEIPPTTAPPPERPKETIPDNYEKPDNQKKLDTAKQRALKRLGDVDRSDSWSRNKIEKLEALDGWPVDSRQLRNVGVAQKAPILKGHLQDKWPEGKWSVKTEYFSMGSAIRSDWMGGGSYPYGAGKLEDIYSDRGQTDAMVDYFDYDNYVDVHDGRDYEERRYDPQRIADSREDRLRSWLQGWSNEEGRKSGLYDADMNGHAKALIEGHTLQDGDGWKTDEFKEIYNQFLDQERKEGRESYSKEDYPTFQTINSILSGIVEQEAPAGNGGAPSLSNGNGDPENGDDKENRRGGIPAGYYAGRKCPEGQVYRDGKCVDNEGGPGSGPQKEWNPQTLKDKIVGPSMLPGADWVTKKLGGQVTEDQEKIGEEGGKGSGKVGHRKWMKGMEQDPEYGECPHCKIITEQIDHVCQMCKKRV